MLFISSAFNNVVIIVLLEKDKDVKQDTKNKGFFNKEVKELKYNLEFVMAGSNRGAIHFWPISPMRAEITGLDEGSTIRGNKQPSLLM